MQLQEPLLDLVLGLVRHATRLSCRARLMDRREAAPKPRRWTALAAAL